MLTSRIDCVHLIRVALLLGALLPALASRAAPLPLVGDWAPNGVQLPALPGSDAEAVSVPDGTGGLFVLWVHVPLSTTNREVRLIHIGATGATDPGWPAGGVLITSATSDASLGTHLLADQAGGVYAIVIQSGFVRVHRLGATGRVPEDWAPGGPLELGAIPYISMPAVSSAGDLWYLRWEQRVTCNVHQQCASQGVLLAIRLRRDGSFAPGWEPPGREVATAGSSEHRATAVGLTGKVGLLSRFNTGTPDFYTVSYVEVGDDARVNGVELGSGFQFGGGLLVLERDAAGHCFTGFDTWASMAAVQQPSPPPLWPAGRVVFLSGAIADILDLVPDEQGGVFALWYESNQRLLSHVTSQGLLDGRWPAPGRPIEPWPQQAELGISSDALGGMYLRRRIEEPDGTQWALQRLTQDGSSAPGWPASGLALRQGPGRARELSSSRDAGRALFVTWSDSRSGEWRIQAQRLGVSLPVATRVELAQGAAQEGEVHLRWRLADPAVGPWFVEGSSDGTEWRPLGEARPASEPRSWAFVDRRPVPGHANHYRLTDARHFDVIGSIMVWMPAAGRLQARLQTSGPNGTPCVIVTGTRPGALRAELRDVQGRLVDVRTLISAGEEGIQLDWGRRDELASGFYWVCVRQDEQRATAKLVLLR